MVLKDTEHMTAVFDGMKHLTSIMPFLICGLISSYANERVTSSRAEESLEVWVFKDALG